ncbi:MAG: hypothetical protein ACI4UJ_10645 [Candidatus Cryptobacteroides sp.]
MNKLRYFLVAGLAITMIAGCDNDETLGENNKGKEKPTVALSIDKRGDVEIAFTITPSESAAQYAYMLCEGKGNDAPLALDLVCGDATGAFNNYMATYSSDETPTKSDTLYVSAGSDYEFFLAAITEEGVLSEVSRVSITTRDYTYPAEGSFIVNYPSLYPDYVLNENSGEPFQADLLFIPDAAPFAPLIKSGYEYILALDLFNIFGSTDDSPIWFVGYNDFENDCLVFDALFDYDSDSQVYYPYDGAFGNLLGFYSYADRIVYALFGEGEDGDQPFTVSYDIDGNLQELSYLEMDLFQYAQGYPYIGIFDAVIGGTFTPIAPSPEI